MGKLRLLFGISIFWLSLSLLSDGINSLVLPSLILEQVSENSKATLLGLLTFAGLLLGMAVQPAAGAASDRLRARLGRKGLIGIGVLFILGSLALLAMEQYLVLIITGYIALQLSISLAQAAQQGFIPDLVPARSRGMASGLKGFMDLGGAMLGFVILAKLLGQGQLNLALAVMASALAAGCLLTMVLVRERLSPGAVVERISLLNAARVDLHQHRLFARLVASRFLFLLGTYAIGRFLLYFVADRLALNAAQASEQAGYLLGALALVTMLAALPAGWAADRVGRLPLMWAGAGLSIAGALLLIPAASGTQILLFGTLLSLGSAAYASANWAFTADLVPPDQAARFFGIANYGTAGAAAAAGLFGPLVDGANRLSPGVGYIFLFTASALSFGSSAWVLRKLTVRGGGTVIPSKEALESKGIEAE